MAAQSATSVRTHYIRSKFLWVTLATAATPFLPTGSGSWLAAATAVSGQHPHRLPDLASDTVRQSLIVEMQCSESESRRPSAVIHFRAATNPWQGGRLEVSVYKDGFRTGRFATLTLNSQTERVALRLSETLRRLAPNAFAFAIDRLGLQRDSVSVEVSPLEPGINYMWRVMQERSGTIVQSGVTRAQALACPSDTPVINTSPIKKH